MIGMAESNPTVYQISPTVTLRKWWNLNFHSALITNPPLPTVAILMTIHSICFRPLYLHQQGKNMQDIMKSCHRFKLPVFKIQIQTVLRCHYVFSLFTLTITWVPFFLQVVTLLVYRESWFFSSHHYEQITCCSVDSHYPSWYCALFSGFNNYSVDQVSVVKDRIKQCIAPVKSSAAVSARQDSVHCDLKY